MKGESRLKQYALAFRLAFLVVSLFVLYRIVDFKLVMHHLFDVPLLVLLFLLAVSILRTWMMGLRWRLLNPDVTGELSGWQYFRLLMISKPYNLIMPGALGGDLVRIGLTMKTVKTGRADNFIAIITDRFVGLFSVMLLGTTSLIFMADIPEKKVFYRIFGLVLSGFLFFLMVATNKRFIGKLESCFDASGVIGEKINILIKSWKNGLEFFKRNYKRVVMAFLICVPVHVTAFGIAFVVAKYLGIEIGFVDICMVFSLVWVITTIPITISGLGVRELSLVYFLSFYGVEGEKAAALSVYLYIITIALGFIGLFFLIKKE